jgi:hypothetical protein
MTTTAETESDRVFREQVLAAGGTLYDPAAVFERLRNDALELAALLTCALRDADPAALSQNLSFAAKAFGDTKLGTGRRPSLSRTLRMLDAMGMEVTVRPKKRRP